MSRRQLRQYIRPAAGDFVEHLASQAPGNEVMIVAEAIEAIKEEATSRGLDVGARTLEPNERERIIAVLRRRDVEEGRRMLLMHGEDYLFAWLDRKLAYHVPYHTLGDAALAQMLDPQ